MTSRQPTPLEKPVLMLVVSSLTLTALACLLTGAPPTPTALPQPSETANPSAAVATIITLEGGVWTRRTPHSVWNVAALGRSLEEGSGLTTAADGRAALEFPAIGIVRLISNTTMQIKTLTTDAAIRLRLVLNLGTLFAWARPAAASDDVIEIETPASITTVRRGTFVRVEYYPSPLRMTIVTCLEERSNCLVTDLENNTDITLRSGQRLVLRPGQPPIIESISQSELIDFIAEMPEAGTI